MKYKIYFNTLIFVFFISCNYKFEKDVEKSHLYYDKYKIKLIGTIIGIQDIDTHEFLMEIAIDKTNVLEHDLRGGAEDYYLYINKDTAYAIEFGIQMFEVGDKIFIDYTNESCFIFKKNGEVGNHTLPLLTLKLYKKYQRERIDVLN